jgi:hypothetical protein
MSKKKIAVRKKRVKKNFCPVCLEEIAYVTVSPSMLRWAPSTHAWRCDSCAIWLLDGSIHGAPLPRMPRRIIEEDGRADGGLHSALSFLARLSNQKERPE